MASKKAPKKKASQTPAKTKSRKKPVDRPIAHQDAEDSHAATASPSTPVLKEDLSIDFLEDIADPIDQIPLELAVYQLSWRWSYFEIVVLTPTLPVLNPPVWIKPDPIQGSEAVEFVYPILDAGNRLSTSKQHDLAAAGLSMCKMHYTIEKIIAILIERLEKEGISQETEVQVAFYGHEIAKRKAFESVINLDNNLVVANFDPGAWGERYLRVVKWLGEQGYGYPSKTPRDIYRRTAKPQDIKPR